jgi:SAM-dependent methyltransferase
MEAPHKKILKAISLEIRKLLEGKYDEQGTLQPGDLAQRLAAIGVRRDRGSLPVDELPHLSPEDVQARKVIDAYLKLREDAGDSRDDAVKELVRETAYTWANRLLALRCMEARGLIDEVVLEKEAYGGRSLEVSRLAKKRPELCAGEDDGRFAVLAQAFERLSGHLPQLFDPQAPGIALRPSAAALKRCFALLSGTEAAKGQDPATSAVFEAPDAFGWAYQYWNTEEKDRVFERVRTEKGAKIAGSDIIPATQLYTESYMVEFLVQNSLGATWMGMHPESQLFEKWDYYVRDADRAPVAEKPVSEISFLDPACGSGHFLLVAFDLLYDMYVEEGIVTEPAAICDSILTRNLYGIDIDARAVQIAEAALWMKAAERVSLAGVSPVEHGDAYRGVPTNLVAAVASHLKGPEWEKFLARFEKEPSVARVLRRFAQSMEHIDELGSLARPAEDLEEIVRQEHKVWEEQVRAQKEANYLFPDLRREALAGQLLFEEISDEQFAFRLMNRARMGLDAFTTEARERGDFQDQFVGRETSIGFKLLDVLGRKYDVVAANPPYMGTSQLSADLLTAVTKYDDAPDLYCALMLRWLDLQASPGMAALVTRSDFLTQAECEAMRATLLAKVSLRVVVRLENRVFADLSNPNAIFFSMQVYAKPMSETARISHASLPESEFDGKANDLLTKIRDGTFRHRTSQSSIQHIPRQPFALNLPEWGYDCYDRFPLFAELAAARQGLITGDTDRFLRYRWEVASLGERWHRYAKVESIAVGLGMTTGRWTGR